MWLSAIRNEKCKAKMFGHGLRVSAPTTDTLNCCTISGVKETRGYCGKKFGKSYPKLSVSRMVSSDLLFFIANFIYLITIASICIVQCDGYVLGPGRPNKKTKIGHASAPGPNYEQQPLQVPQALGLLTENQQHELFENSYIIDNKRFSEIMASRCFTSTIMSKPDMIEPSFTIVKPNGEARINATGSEQAILEAGYEVGKKTVIFVHGFTQSFPETDWLKKMLYLFERLGKLQTYNVIFMDWGKGAKNPFFSAAANAHGMGTFLAIFLQRLINLGTDRMKIHIVAHSLGAHVAGFAGKRIKPPIGRITALDPAGPCFGKFFTNPYNLRLNPNDAYLVDVFHYDDSFLGLAGQHGQFDVYVNGGSSQPGCTDNVQSMMSAFVTVMFGRDRVLSESHTRSTEVPVLPLKSGYCQHVAYECSDYDTFLAGECGQCDDLNNQCYLMDFEFQFDHMDDFPLRTSRPGKKLFIKTSDKEDFCMQHYQIKITLFPNTLSNWFKNKVSLQLASFNGTRVTADVDHQMSDNELTSLLTFTGPPQRFTRAKLVFPKGTKLTRNIKLIEINFMSNINSHIRKVLSSNLCPVSQFTLIEKNVDPDEYNDGHFVECL